ncbi:MAG: LLM class F420-dependent oxidoreductase [Candidatus Binataceae bacterium]
MKLGLHLPQFSGSPRDLAKVASFAEDSGYSTIWVSEHLLTPHMGGAIPPVEIMDPLVTLGYVAALTTTIRLATSVIVVPYHNPIHLAKELATLDRLCEGRLVAGLASGWLEPEFRALGAPYEKRGIYTDEAIRLMRACWASEAPQFNGDFFDLSGMHFGPRPAAGRIPIWVGGLSRRAIRRAVELGDGWHATRSTPEELAQRLGWLREIAAKKGKSLDRFAISHRVYVGFAPKWTETGGYVRGIMAPPEELANYLNRYAQLGVRELLVTPLGTQGAMEDFLERFDREVRPKLI